jgi:hypothetical protein
MAVMTVSTVGLDRRSRHPARNVPMAVHGGREYTSVIAVP